MFKNNSFNSSILIRLWEWCVTNCYNCSSYFDKKNEYDYEKFENVFLYLNKNFEKTFSIFLYWTEVIFHKDIYKFITDEKIKDFRLSLHINPLFSEERLKKIKEISYFNEKIFFETCYTIKNDKEMLSILKNITFLKKENIKSSMDLFLDFNKYLSNFLNILKKLWFSIIKTDITSHLNYDFCINCSLNNINIILYHTKEQFIKDDKIYNIPNNWCVARHTFEVIDNNYININEEIEITKEWIFKMHINTYCSKAIQNISNIYKDKDEIIKDFIKLDKYLEKYDDFLDMWKKCFDCIKNPYV